MEGNKDRVLYNTYYSDQEAYIDKGVLETNGVKCWIVNEIFSSVYPITHNSVGGIQLWIRKEDTEMAMKIMRQ